MYVILQYYTLVVTVTITVTIIHKLQKQITDGMNNDAFIITWNRWCSIQIYTTDFYIRMVHPCTLILHIVKKSYNLHAHKKFN